MKFLQASLIVSSLLLLGRFSGFARDWFLGWQYGAGLESDLAILVLTIPDLVVNVVLGGGVAAALVPEFRRLTPDRGAGLLVQALVLIVAGMSVIALVAAFFSHQLMALLAPGLPREAVESGQQYFAIAVIAIPLTAACGALSAWLDANGRFQFSASGTAIFNVCVLSAMIFLGTFGLLYAVTFGVLAGALIRLCFQGAAAARVVVEAPSFAPVEYWSIIRRFGSAFLFSSVLALLPAIARALASQHVAGSLSIFSYAVKVIELPMTLAVSAISVVLLPRLASEFQQGTGQVANSAGLALRAVSLICIGLAIPAAFFPDSVFRAIFPSGVFTGEQRAIMSAVFVSGVIFLPVRGVMVICLSILAAAGLTRHLAVAALVLIGSFALSDLALVGSFDLVGVMLSMSLSMLAAAAYMVTIAYRELGSKLLVVWFGRFLTSYLPAIAASIFICYLGDLFSTLLIVDVAVGILSFCVFVAISFGLDRKIWFPSSGAITKA